MSPRAAWRLEELGFTDVYDYVGSKADWFSNGEPREGTSVDVPWTGDLVREAPTCSSDDRVGEVRDRVTSSGLDICVVLNDERVVLGVLRGDVLAKHPDAPVGDVLDRGPKTQRPNTPVKELLASSASYGVKSWVVTTPHGVFLGLVTRDDAERALEASATSA
jgi:CBS domain-containing protein